jgi:hypothetical protein
MRKCLCGIRLFINTRHCSGISDSDSPEHGGSIPVPFLMLYRDFSRALSLDIAVGIAVSKDEGVLKPGQNMRSSLIVTSFGKPQTHNS